MTNWKEIEDVGKPCSDENGWCGRCREHSEDLHRQEEESANDHD